MPDLTHTVDPTERHQVAMPASEVGMAAVANLAPTVDTAPTLSSDDARSPTSSGIRPIHHAAPAAARAPEPCNGSHGRALRVEQLVGKHFRMVWRVAQRLGLQPADAEDVALRVMLIASNRIDDIAESSERAFLVTTTRFVAGKVRKARDRRMETMGEDLSELAVDRTAVDEVTDQRRALAQLDRVLAQLPEDLRTVLVLFEIEGFSQSEIGAILRLPQGTVASRIRRAKVQFLRIATRFNLLPRGTV